MDKLDAKTAASCSLHDVVSRLLEKFTVSVESIKLECYTQAWNIDI